MNYDSDYYNPYKVRMLGLYFYRVPGKELIWQGTATGSIMDIRVDAASHQLAKAVMKILKNFPPRR